MKELHHVENKIACRCFACLRDISKGEMKLVHTIFYVQSHGTYRLEERHICSDCNQGYVAKIQKQLEELQQAIDLQVEY